MGKKRPACRLRLAPLVLCFVAGAAAAAPPKSVIVTREAQDVYRVGVTGVFYIKTLNCQENVFSDRADLRLSIGTRGGTLLFRSGRQCVIDKFLKEVEPSQIRSTDFP